MTRRKVVWEVSAGIGRAPFLGRCRSKCPKPVAISITECSPPTVLRRALSPRPAICRMRRGMNRPDDIDRTTPVLIAGPTASGKSALALDIAARAGGVIVNADSMQVYENWRILSARPSADDENAAPHALYGHVPRFADYSAGHWLRDVLGLLTDGPRPI